MECKFERTPVLTTAILTIFSLGLFLAPSCLSVSAATSFGVDYRHLTTVSPGGTPNTTTSIAVGSGATGTFIVNPYTSGSTATGTPSTTSLSGYGWRTAGAVGSSIPAGTWSFTVTTQTSLTSALGNGKVKIYAYSTNTLGSNLSFIGSATGTTNIFGILTAQTETISFSVGPVDLSNKVLVVEYWIDVTTGPLLATTVTFQAASSTQTAVLPSSSGTFYLGMSSLFSVGESESAPVSDTLARSMALIRALSDSPVTSDSNPSRTTVMSRTVAEGSAAAVTDSISKFTGFIRDIAEPSGAVASASTSSAGAYSRQVSEISSVAVNDGTSRIAEYARQVSEISSVAVNDGTSRIAEYARQVSETSGTVMGDSISRLVGFARNVTETSGALATDGVSRASLLAREISETSTLVSDFLNPFFSPFDPPSDEEDRGNRGGGRGGGGRSAPIVDEPPVDETPPIHDEGPVKGRDHEVEVMETIRIQSEENISPGQTLGQIRFEVTISSTLNAISTSFQPIPPSAVGAVTLSFVNNADTPENVALHYWCIDESTGLVIMEGTEEIALSPYQSFSRSLDITFLWPGEFSLGANVTRSDGGGEARGMTAMQIAVPWITVYLNLLITVIVAGASAAIGSWAAFTRQSRRKRSMN